MENSTPSTAIFVQRNEAWENSFEEQIKKLKKEHPSLLSLTTVNEEQIKNFNCLPDKGVTGIILEKNYIWSCYPYYGNMKAFKAQYPDGIVWIAQKEKRKEVV